MILLERIHNSPVLHFCMFMVNCLLLRSNFHECYLPKFDVSFQKSLCRHAENSLMRISLQTNLCFIMHDAFEILRERHFIFALTLLSSRK